MSYGKEHPRLPRKQLKRGQAATCFAHLSLGLVAMDACSSSHWCTRKLHELRHSTRTIATSAASLRPSVCRIAQCDIGNRSQMWKPDKAMHHAFVALQSHGYAGGSKAVCE